MRTDKIEVYGITVCIHKPLMSLTLQIPFENIQSFIPAYWPDDFKLFIQPAFPIADRPTISAQFIVGNFSFGSIPHAIIPLPVLNV